LEGAGGSAGGIYRAAERPWRARPGGETRRGLRRGSRHFLLRGRATRKEEDDPDGRARGLSGGDSRADGEAGVRDQAVSAAERGERVRAGWASVCVRAGGVARAEPGRKGAGPRREGWLGRGAGRSGGSGPRERGVSWARVGFSWAGQVGPSAGKGRSAAGWPYNWVWVVHRFGLGWPSGFLGLGLGFGWFWVLPFYFSYFSKSNSNKV